MPTVKETFAVTGMTCASCAVSTESIVKAQPGVVSAAVNFATGLLQVEYTAGAITPRQIQKAVQSIGYNLILEDDAARTQQQEAAQQHYQQLKRHTIFAAIITVPLMGGMFFMHYSWVHYASMLLAAPVVFWFGRSFFVNAAKQLTKGRAGMDTLVALSTGIAYMFSAFVTLFPHALMVNGQHPSVYFEGAAFVVTFVLLGKLLEERAKARTSEALKKLMGLQPATVTLIQFGFEEKEVPLSEVKTGDILLVKPGDKIPVDGVVVLGESYVDESTITGEPIPTGKQTGSKVYAGTLNQSGSFRLRAAKVGGQTVLAQIIKVVEDAQGSKAPVQKLVDKVAAVFVPVVVVIAALTFAAWLWWGGSNPLPQALLSAITVLVIACPCALGLATPTAIMVGIGKGALNGILIKDADSLEQAAQIDTIVLDKTGTITQGHPTVAGMLWLPGANTTEAIALLRAIESQSSHPLAVAVTNYLPKGAALSAPPAIENISGKGIKATYHNQTYYVGNLPLLADKGIAIDAALQQQCESWLKEAHTVFFFANAQQALVVIAVADEIKPTSKEAIAELGRMGITVYMLTGDNEQSAAAVAERTGIQHYKAGMLPIDKHHFLKQLQQQGRKVAMVGDGINDTQALAVADVSVAMGKGSDIAIDVAQMTLITGDLLKLPMAFSLSKQTNATIQQNLFWAFVYNLVGIPVAAGVLYPWGITLTPEMAAAAMALSSVSVVGNSLRLQRKKL